MGKTYKIVVSDADSFLTSGLVDEGSFYHTTGSVEHAMLDVPIAIESGTISLEAVEVKAYVDLGPTPLLTHADGIERPIDERRGLRSVVGAASDQRLIANSISLQVLDADGKPLSNPYGQGGIGGWGSRTPATVSLCMQRGERIMLPLATEAVILRLICRGAVKRLSRVRASVIGLLADSEAR